MKPVWADSQSFTIPLNQGEPSKWWAWGIAIFIGIMAIFGAFGSIVNILMPYDLIMSQSNWNPENPGTFPQNGSAEEQNTWNSTNEEWSIYQNMTQMFDEMQGGLGQDVCLLTFVSGAIALIACTMLIQRNQNGFTMAGIWLLISTIGQIVLAINYSTLSASFYPAEQQWIAGISLASNIGGTVVCNLSILAIVIVCATKHKGEADLPESGFHRNSYLNNPEEK